MNRLEGKSVIVTGGSSGIGEATVEEFVKEGGKIVIADINEEDGKALEKKLKDQGADVIFVKTDMSDEKDIKNLVSTTVESFGKLDVVISNAGIARKSLAHEMSSDDWNKVIAVNQDGVFLLAKYAITEMLKTGGGSIVNVASICGHIAPAEQISYNAAKHAVVGITKSLSNEYAKNNIRVNAICPGYIETPILDVLSEEERAGLINLHPIGRLGQSPEIAKAALFLASEDASFVTGSSLMVDGGYTAL